jgi:hypothetical protein
MMAGRKKAAAKKAPPKKAAKKKAAAKAPAKKKAAAKRKPAPKPRLKGEVVKFQAVVSRGVSEAINQLEVLGGYKDHSAMLLSMVQREVRTSKDLSESKRKELLKALK